MDGVCVHVCVWWGCGGGAGGAGAFWAGLGLPCWPCWQDRFSGHAVTQLQPTSCKRAAQQQGRHACPCTCSYCARSELLPPAAIFIRAPEILLWSQAGTQAGSSGNDSSEACRVAAYSAPHFHAPQEKRQQVAETFSCHIIAPALGGRRPHLSASWVFPFLTAMPGMEAVQQGYAVCAGTMLEAAGEGATMWCMHACVVHARMVHACKLCCLPVQAQRKAHASEQALPCPAPSSPVRPAHQWARAAGAGCPPPAAARRPGWRWWSRTHRPQPGPWSPGQQPLQGAGRVLA